MPCLVIQKNESFRKKAEDLGFVVIAIASNTAMLEIYGWVTVVPISDFREQNYKTLAVVRGRLHERTTSKFRKFKLT